MATTPKRRSIEREATVQGTGLHTGASTRAVFRPGAAGRGIVFRRTDLAGTPEVPARLSEVEALDESSDASDKRGFAVSVVMQMDLDVRNTGSGQSCEPVDRRRVVLLLRIEERVARRSAAIVRVPSGDERPAIGPSPDTLERGSIVAAPPPRFEVVRNRDPDPLDRRPAVRDVAQARGGVSGQPQR